MIDSPFRIENIRLLMTIKISAVNPFNVDCEFAEWEIISDIKHSDIRHKKFDINPLFRGFSIKHPQKVIFILMTGEGYIQKFLNNAKSILIEGHKVDCLVMKESSWI